MKLRVRSLYVVFALATINVVSVLSGCEYQPWSLPAQGPYYVSNVTPETQQNHYFCVPAVAKMWRAQQNRTPAYSQQFIWDQIVLNYPGSAVVGDGVYGDGVIRDVFAGASGLTLDASEYSKADVQQALADQGRGVQNNRLTAVGINNGTHVALVTGASWRRLPDAIQRPYVETVKVTDPANGILHANFAIEPWMFVMGTSWRNGGSVQFQVVGQRGSGETGLNLVNSMGGAYSGVSAAGGPGRYRYDGNGTCYWEPHENGKYQCVPNLPPPPPGGANVLEPGERLYGGQGISSPDGRFFLTYQSDGNFVLYGPPGPIWWTNTFDSPGYMEMQGDGNFVMYNSGGAPIWHSNTSGYSGARLVLQSDGNVVIYSNNIPVWATDTGGW